MALQHARALLWTAEDLGFGGQRSTQRTLSAVVQGTQPLTVLTAGFVGLSTMPASLLGTNFLVVVQGFNRVFVNRSPKYFITLSATLQDTGTKPIQIPIAPLQAVFLPTNLIGTSATLQADTAYTIPLPPNVAQTAIPKAGSNTQLHYDYLREY